MARRSFIQGIADVHIRTRGYLPHWRLAGATYSVNFSLHGSLPRHVEERLREERRAMQRAITGGVRALTALENMDVRAEFEKRLDDELHKVPGTAYMNDVRIADMVACTLQHFREIRYTLHAWCVMPNHVHAIVTPAGDWTLDAVLHSWKSYSSNCANRVLAREGRFWCREYFDRIIRDEHDFASSIQYVLDNPVKAGLSDWRWTSARF